MTHGAHASLYNPMTHGDLYPLYNVVWPHDPWGFVTIAVPMTHGEKVAEGAQFLGNDQAPPGPLGYQWLIHNSGLSIIPNLMFMLNNWLADGLLVSSSSTLVV